MRIVIESTTKTVTVDGVPARLWEGHTDSGIAVHCYITRVAVHRDDDTRRSSRPSCRSIGRPATPTSTPIPNRLLL